MYQFSSYNYLTEQSAGDIIKNALTIYTDYFSTFFTAFFLPVISWILLYIVLFITLAVMGNESMMSAFVLLWTVISVFVWLVAVVSITVIVSDICVGNSPIGVWQSFRVITPALLGKLSLSYILYFLLMVALYSGALYLGSLLAPLMPRWALAGGLILAVFFIFIAVVLPMFFPSIIVLEGRWGFNALARSVRLGRGFYLRNLGILLLFFTCFIAGSMLLRLVVGVMPPPISLMIGLVAVAVVYLTFVCFPIICVVLMYYDMRVRKEGYDAAALAEDLRL